MDALFDRHNELMAKLKAAEARSAEADSEEQEVFLSVVALNEGEGTAGTVVHIFSA